MICDHVPGVKGWDVGSRRKKRFAAAAPLLSQTQLEHAAFRNRFEGIQGAIDKPLLIGAPAQNPEARRTDAGTTLSPSRRKNTSGACAKAIGSRRR
jgi:hypothetical protein